MKKGGKPVAKRPQNKNGANAVIYAWYSSHNQRDVSIEQQYAACEGFAAREGFVIVDRYADGSYEVLI